MGEEPTVEVLGDHAYVLHLQDSEGGAVEIQVYASPDVLDRLRTVNTTDEQQAVEATIAYLIARQRAEDLPPFLDLDDVAAAYEGYLDDVRGRLTRG